MYDPVVASIKSEGVGGCQGKLLVAFEGCGGNNRYTG